MQEGGGQAFQAVPPPRPSVVGRGASTRMMTQLPKEEAENEEGRVRNDLLPALRIFSCASSPSSLPYIFPRAAGVRSAQDLPS